MRLADFPPVVCSGCFQQKPQDVHVDFEVTFQGPVIDQGQIGLASIDDNVVCASCLESAGKLVGLGRVEEVYAELEARDIALAEALERVAALEEHAAALEATIVSKLALDRDVEGQAAPAGDRDVPAAPKPTRRRRTSAAPAEGSGTDAVPQGLTPDSPAPEQLEVPEV